MGHELSIRGDGTVEAAYAGERPWHGLGTMVHENMTPLEALRKANMDWDVRKRSLHYDNHPATVKVPDRFAIVREDTNNYLGTVGTQYTPIQNTQQAEFIEALVGESNSVVECVGALFGGKKTFWTCKLNSQITVGKNDHIDKYLIVTNSHDGSGSFRAFWSPIRVVCNNTLSASLRNTSIKEGVALRHTSNIHDRVEDAKRILGFANDYYDELGEAFNHMTEKKIDVNNIGSTIESIFEVEDNSTAMWKNTLAELRNSFVAEAKTERYDTKKNPSSWLLYNTITRYTSHSMFNKSRLNLSRRETRWKGLYSGRGKKINERAFDLLPAVSTN